MRKSFNQCIRVFLPQVQALPAQNLSAHRVTPDDQINRQNRTSPLRHPEFASLDKKRNLKEKKRRLAFSPLLRQIKRKKKIQQTSRGEAIQSPGVRLNYSSFYGTVQVLPVPHLSYHTCLPQHPTPAIPKFRQSLPSKTKLKTSAGCRQSSAARPQKESGLPVRYSAPPKIGNWRMAI